MRIGSLNRRITIQRLEDGQDEIGQPVRVWVDVVKVWADVRYLSGIETVRSDVPVSVAKASIRIRRRQGVDATMRVLLGDTVFAIQAVLPNERSREYIDLACETGANDG